MANATNMVLPYCLWTAMGSHRIAMVSWRCLGMIWGCPGIVVAPDDIIYAIRLP